MDEGKFDFIFKIVLVGDSGVGKTNLLLRITQNKFDSASKSTIGVEFAPRMVQVEGKSIKAQVWDTAGQERYRAIASAYYRGAMGVLLVFDVSNFISFENVARWVHEIEDHTSSHEDEAQHLVLVLIGNKIDKEKREVTKEEAQKLAQQKNMAYFETSALSAANVEEMFQETVKQIYFSYGFNHDHDNDDDDDDYSRNNQKGKQSSSSSVIHLTPPPSSTSSSTTSSSSSSAASASTAPSWSQNNCC